MSNDLDFSDNLAPLDVGAPEFRIPPNNIEAEQALLGAILVNNDAANKVSDFLGAEHFHEPVHGRIYSSAMKLIEKGQIANPVTLKYFFEQDEALEDVGGAQYLARLAGAAITIINAAHYGRAIHDLAMRRSLIAIGEDLVNDAFDNDMDRSASEQLEEAEQSLFTLAESGSHEGGFVDFGSAMAEAIEIADAAMRHDGLSGVSMGLKDLDNILGGLHPSDLLILAGRPAMGKTALATNVGFAAARAHAEWQARDGKGHKGAVVGFFSLEMSAEQLANRILAEQANIPSDKIRRGDIHQTEFSRLAAKAQELADLPLFIDDTPALSIAGLRTRARRLHRTHGLGLVIVDYLQLLHGGARGHENRVQEISEITRGLKALAKDLNVPVLALSQLSRAVEQRDDKRPQLSDLRESGSIEQDADVVMFVFREEYYHERQQPDPDSEKHQEWLEKAEKIHGVAEVIVGKQRHGPTGTVKLSFQNEITKFGDLEYGNYDNQFA